MDQQRQGVTAASLEGRLAWGQCMRVEVVSTEGGVRLRLVGELDVSTVGLVRRTVARTGLDGDLTLDLSHLSFMDAQGVHLFLDLARAREGTGWVVLERPVRVVRRILGLTRIERVVNLRVVDDAEELGEFSGQVR